MDESDEDEKERKRSTIFYFKHFNSTGEEFARKRKMHYNEGIKLKEVMGKK